MRFTCLSALFRRLLRFPSYCVTMHAFTRMSASIKTAFAFFFVWRYNVCVSHACLRRLRRLLRFPSYGVTMYAFHACLRRLRRLLRFPWYGVTMHAFHTLFFIYYERLCVFLRIALQCMRFTGVSASVKTVFAFSLVWRQSASVSQASLQRLRRLLRFPWYCITMHAFQMRVCIG